MPGIHGQFGRAKSRLSSRGRIKTQKPVEVFESSHPERYGLDESYPGVVVVQEKGDGQVIEVSSDQRLQVWSQAGEETSKAIRSLNFRLLKARHRRTRRLSRNIWKLVIRYWG